MSKAFDKLVKDCEAADIAEQKKQTERAMIVDRVNHYRNEINACESQRNRLLEQAQQIVADAKAESQKKIEAAEEIRHNAAKWRDRLAKAEIELRVLDGKPPVSPMVAPTVLGLGR